MKKLLSIMTMLSLSACATAGFNGNTAKHNATATTTVAQALKVTQDDTPVQLTGKIVRQIDNDEFIFRDKTGEIKIDVEDNAWQGLNVNENETITIFGQVDYDKFEKNSIDVYRVQK